MKKQLIELILPILVILFSLFLSRGKIENLGIELDILNDFSALYSKSTIFPFIYDVEKILNVSDYLLYQKYVEAITPYNLIILFSFIFLLYKFAKILLGLLEIWEYKVP